MKKVLLLIAINVLFNTNAGSRELFPLSGKPEFVFGAQMPPNATQGGYILFQGESKWQEIYERSYRNNVNTPLVQTNWIQTENGTLIASMSVTTNLEFNSATNDYVSQPCKREDVLFAKDLGGKFTNVNCVTVNHITRYFENPTGVYQMISRKLTEEGIRAPLTVLRVSVTRYAGSGRIYEMYVDINPEVLGFKSEGSRLWGASDWHKSVAFNDPQKAEFIKQLSAWAIELGQRVDVAFGYSKPQDAFVGMPSWRLIEPPKPAETAPKKIFN